MQLMSELIAGIEDALKRSEEAEPAGWKWRPGAGGVGPADLADTAPWQ